MDNNTFCTYYEYVPSGSVRLFTAILLPNATEKFPVVILRNPYVDKYETIDEAEIVREYTELNVDWLKSGFAVVMQHCRGRGKSEGDCIPYINEREDGLALQAWIRKQPFYNGELFLRGNSYLTSVHYATAPFADDIKGAIFGVQDCERYNICYRNGFKKVGLNASWYVQNYKTKSHLKKNFTQDSFLTLPLSNFSKTVFGECAPAYDEIMKHPKKDDPFWNTRWGGSDARGAIAHAKFPILLTTGFYDIYTGGIFTMWNEMDDAARNRSALVVSANDHGDNPNQPIVFPAGQRKEQFGENYEIEWFRFIRGERPTSPFEQGKITYYHLFQNTWKTDDFSHRSQKTLRFGEETHTYVYNPYAPASFKGGLCCNFGGVKIQDEPNSRYDIISVYSEPFAQDTLIKGKMSGKLKVASDCEDTCFYVRLSITKEEGDYGLRDDITSLCWQHPDYIPGSEVTLDFSFDEHAFMIKAGERIRMDISSSAANLYVRHTNQKGLYSEQTTAKIAHNTVFLKDSRITLPVE